MQRKSNISLSPTSRYAVLGSGSWATAIVKILSYGSGSLGWYVRSQETLDHIKKYGHNPKYLSSVNIDTNKVWLTDNLDEVVERADVLIIAIPSAFMAETLKGLTTSISTKFIVSAVKGIVPESHLTIAEYFNQEHLIPFDNIGVVTGPCHAEEVALERLSYLTLACKSRENAQMLADRFECHFIKTTTTTDIYGVEYAAVLKNIYAIASGICHGLGYGDNFQAVLVSNAQRELKRFLDGTYPSKRNVDTSAYLGDLLVTCYSNFSRNRTFGSMIGKGYTVKATMAEMNMVAEGYFAASCINALNKKYLVNMPIADAVFEILYQGANPRPTIQQLVEQLK
jgi:glycerol-3-phosphate dehydrogenase (NAD(P)+)